MHHRICESRPVSPGKSRPHSRYAHLRPTRRRPHLRQKRNFIPSSKRRGMLSAGANKGESFCYNSILSTKISFVRLSLQSESKTQTPFPLKT